MSEQRFHESLRSELVRAAGEEYGDAPSPSRNRRWVLVAAAIVVLTDAMAAVMFGPDQDLSADVQIVVDGDDLIVRLSGIETSREEIEAAAEEFGLDVTVEEVPVGPSNVGAFVGSTASELPPLLVPIDGEGYSFRGFRIPKDWDGELVLSVGREAEPGEMWMLPSDAQAAGEPAECMQLIGMSVANASRALAGRDLDLRWFAMGPAPIEYEGDSIDSIASWEVVRVEATSPTALQIQATEDGSAPPGPSVDDGGIPRATNPDC